MIKKICLGIVIVLLAITVASYGVYLDFRGDKFDALETNSQIAITSLGPVEYQMTGEEGPVVLFLHGTPGGYDLGLTMEGYRVLSPSRPGYLRTPITTGRTPLDQANAYLALLEKLDIDKVIVIGASGGGPSALSFASSFPDRTIALVALEAVSQTILEEEAPPSIPAFMQTDFLMWVSLSLMNNLMDDQGVVSMLVPNEKNQQLILSSGNKIEEIKSIVWSIWPPSKRVAGMLNDISQFSALSLRNEKIISPTLIIHGTEDNNVQFHQSEQLSKQIAGSIFHVIEGGDHMMPFSHSEEVDTAIEEFLSVKRY